MSIEIQTEDVVKLILQFCSENGLDQTMKTMQQETQVSLNVLDSVEKFNNDIIHGKWDQVLLQVQKLKVQSDKLMELYEVIVQEMLELGENETALTIVNEAIRPVGLFTEFPERCLRLEYLSKRQKVDIQEIYMDKQTKDKRRANVAQKLCKEVGSAPSQRLLYLLGQSLKYQESQGDIQPNIKLNIFTGHVPPAEDEIDKPTITIEKKMKYGNEFRIECLNFSKDGKYLATGSIDGIIELHNPVTCEIDKNLVYQNEENYLMHRDPILSICFSDDNELLASADKKGLIKIWRVQTGKLLKKIEGSFSSNITNIIFGKEFSHLIAASQEIKVLGLKSGKALKEFRGHTGYVTQMVINDESTRLISGSTDGTIKFWDYKSTECVMNFMPPSDSQGLELDIFNVLDMGKRGVGAEPLILVCNKSDTMNILNWRCQMQSAYSNEKKEDFISAAVSSHKNLLYGASDKNYIYIFNYKTGKLDNFFRLIDENDNDEILGIVHHPLRNILTVYTHKGNLYYLKP